MKRSSLRRAAPETVRIGNMEFEIPAGTSKARRREFIAAAEQHVLERGEISVADANRLLRQREKRTASALREVAKRDRPKHRSKYARRPREFDRMAWIRTQPCVIRTESAQWWATRGSAMMWRGGDVSGDRCEGTIEAHHAGIRGVGQKALDDTVVPLCSHHHRDLTDRRGLFADWPPGTLKAWELGVVDHYQRRYELLSRPDLY